MRNCRLACVCLLLCRFAGTASAERYAVLVGVSKYAMDGPAVHLNLDGPAEDVRAMRKALMERQGFKDTNIFVLLDKDATRQGILDRLGQTIRAMKDGDYLLFFFGGHGTSAFDKNNQPIAAFIGPNSGALAPHDLRLESAESAAGSLIIGHRDLRPLLERLPPRSKALVLLDACYSENSVKNIPPRVKGKTRGITLETLIPGGSTPASSRKPSGAAGGGPVALAAAPMDRTYPYSNVVALTAASKDEPAAEVDGTAKAGGGVPTIDGKPHGVFTDSLLRALSGAGDLNHDGKITFRELLDYSRQTVQAHYPQTPQLLAPESQELVNSPAFAGDTQTAPPCQTSRQTPAGNVRIFLENVQGDLRERLTKFREIELTEQSADFVIRTGAAGYDLYDGAGSMVRQFLKSETEQLVARVRAEPALRRFVGFEFSCQAFSASLRLLPEGQSRFSSRDRMQIEGQVDRPAYLVLFNVDKSGAVSIVYPATAEERRQKSAGEKIHLGTVRPTAPFGSEYLKLLAFPAEPPFQLLGCKPAANGNLVCPDIQPYSREFEALYDFIGKAEGGGAETRIRFTTFPE